jgi:hypothetical protein
MRGVAVRRFEPSDHRRGGGRVRAEDAMGKGHALPVSLVKLSSAEELLTLSANAITKRNLETDDERVRNPAGSGAIDPRAVRHIVWSRVRSDHRIVG